MSRGVSIDSVKQQAPALQRVTDAMWRSRWWVLVLALIGAVLGALIGGSTPARYSSSALLLASPLEQPMLGFDRATNGLSSELTVLDTPMQLMMTPAHLQAVAEELLASGEAGDLVRLLAADNDFEDLFATSPSTAMREYIAENLTVRQQGRADIISVSFLSGDPGVAALVANAVANIFLRNQAATRRAEADRIAQALADRVSTLEEEARSASGLVQRYTAEAGLVLPRASQQEMLAQLTMTLLEAQTERDALDSRLRELRGRIATGSALSEAPDVSGPEVIAPLEAETAADDGAASSDFLMQEITRSEADFEETDLELRLDAAARRVEVVQGAVAELQDQIVARVGAESELDLLQRNATAVSDMYSQMLTRLQEVIAEESLIAPDLRLVSPAIPPRHSVTAGTPLLAAMGFLAFALLGLGATLLTAAAREERSDRV